MKFLKKNQIIIYVLALMLMTAGYLNYVSNHKENSVETSMQIESNDDMLLANTNIGDATLVSSQDIISENTAISNTTSEESTNTIDEQNSTEQTSSNVKSDDYFAKSKLERDTMYSQMIDTYEKVLNSSNAIETQKQSATQEITKINETKNSIMICENLIKTKGFENNIIFVNGESISVIIGASEIKQEEVAQIQNIIAREMNAEIENIHISTK